MGLGRKEVVVARGKQREREILIFYLWTNFKTHSGKKKAQRGRKKVRGKMENKPQLEKGSHS